MENKWWVDEIYDWLIVRRYVALANFLVDVIDRRFNWMDEQITTSTQKVATILRTTQTGQLNWNMVGIIGGLVVVLTVLAWGA